MPLLPERLRSFGLAAIVSLVGAGFTLWPFTVHGGIPGYQHDWSWPFYASRGCDALSTVGSTWTDDGLGHANPFATANPIAYLIGGSACLLGPDLSVRVYLLGITLVAGLGVFTLCEGLLIGTPAALLAIFFYLCAPPLFNKISAGHFAYWASFALFPWVFATCWRVARTPSALTVAYAALVLALSCMQPQFYVFDVIVLLCLVPAVSSFRSLVALFSALLLSLAMNAPALVASYTLMPAFRATVPMPLLPFEYMQSAQPFDALRLLGYISGYADAAYMRSWNPAFESILLSLISLAAISGLFFAPRIARGSAAILGVCGFSIMTGLRGPASAVFSWLFEHVSAAALLREFYHAAVMLVLAYAIGIAYLARRSRIVLATACVLTVLAFLPMSVDGHSRDLNFISVPKPVASSMSKIRSLRPSRFLPLPYKMPLHLNSFIGSGVDGFAYADSLHTSAAEYAATPRLDAIASIASSYAKRDFLQDQLGRLAVHSVVLRLAVSPVVSASLRSWGVPFDPSTAATMFAGSSLFREITGERCAQAACYAVLNNDADFVDVVRKTAPLPLSILNERPGEAYVDAGAPPTFTAHISPSTLSPYEGWVDSSVWIWPVPAWASLNNAFAVTAVPAVLTVSVPEVAELAYVASHRGLVACRGKTCQAWRSSSVPRRVRLLPGVWKIKSQGPAALAAPHARLRLPVIGNVELANWRRQAAWSYTASLSGQGTALLVLRNQYDAGWGLHGAQAKHVRVDGYANGWLVSVHGNTDIRLRYGPQRDFNESLGVSIIAYLAALFAILLSRDRAFKGVSTS